MDSETRLLALAVLLSAVALVSAVSFGIAVKVGAFDEQSDSHGGQLEPIEIEYERVYIAGFEGIGFYVITFTAPCDGWMVVKYGTAQQHSDERAFHKGENSIIVPRVHYVSPAIEFYVYAGGHAHPVSVQDRGIEPYQPYGFLYAEAIEGIV